MLLLIVGSIGSGKSAFAEQLAMSLGREAIRLSCPPFPDGGLPAHSEAAERGRDAFSWTEMTADASLASTLHLINRKSNIFRAEQRVLVVDSLSGWLREWASRAAQTAWQPGAEEPQGGDSLQLAMDAVLAFSGTRIVISEEPVAGLSPDHWERWYSRTLADALRQLAEHSRCVYRLTAGVAMEVKGQRVKRGMPKHEHLY